jgi:pantetheine-phosphate adenylyltransferase
MVEEDKIIMKLVRLLYTRCGFTPDMAVSEAKLVIDKWHEPHRYFHTLKHLNYILTSIENVKEWDEYSVDALSLAAYYHDVVYDPSSKYNEEHSAVFFMEHTNSLYSKDPFIITVNNIILETDLSKTPSFELSVQFRKLDTSSIYEASFEELIAYEESIFKEYQCYSYKYYKVGRIKLLQELLRIAPNTTNHIYDVIQYIQSRQPKIAIYPGSFNPFHVGHLAILKKAEQIFDKVIIAVGHNPAKPDNSQRALQGLKGMESTRYHEIVLVDGLLTDYVSQVEQSGCNVTVVKGLRNGADLDYEVNQLRFMKDMKPDFKVVYMPCDIEYEHVSSSAIRQLLIIDPKTAQKYIPK